jgi:DNA-directed RNA polymerase specialized sigma24 family protein
MKDEILTEYAIKGVVAVLIFVAVYVFIAFSVYSCLSDSEKEEVQNIEMQRCHVTKLRERERVRMKDTLDDRISALYEPLLLRAKVLLSGDVEMARDVTSYVILRMLSNKDKFEDGTNLNAWGYTILKNSFINLHKRYSNKSFFER